MEFFLRSLLPDDREVTIVVDRAASSSSSSSLSRRSSCCSIASQVTSRWGGDHTGPIEAFRDSQGFIGFEKFVTMQSLPRIPKRRNSNEADSTNSCPRNEILDHSLGPLPRRRASDESIDESDLRLVRQTLINQMNLSSGSIECEGLFNEGHEGCLLTSPIQDGGSIGSAQLLSRRCSPKSSTNSKSSLLRSKLMDRRSESSNDSLTQVINLVDLMTIASR